MSVREPTADRAALLVEKHGSPLYVYDAERVRAAYRDFTAAFPYSPVDFHYAIVCNKNRHLVRLLYAMGAGIHANTPGDAFAALNAGVPAHRILYSGTNLDAADLDFLIGHRIRLNLDSVDQLRDFAQRSPGGAVGLRLLVDDPSRPNRIGVDPEELPEALAIARAAGVRLIGLHIYAGTNNRSLARFLACFDRMLAASELLPDLEELDAGGGFGVPYREGQEPLDLPTLGREVARRMEELSARRGRRIRLIIEPGRVLVAEAGSLLVKVISVKERGGRRYVGVDTTVGNVVVESVYYPHHRVEAVEPQGSVLEIPTDVCGNTTHSRDFLARNCQLPPLAPGDLLALRDVGAYGYAMSSHFLNRPRPAEVVIDQGQDFLTTRRETFADLLATQVDA
ncbi:diaminopimelate decarboxylase family protein [Hyalangium sp.]|uniref:diaminopimelate decarboxylase family protein n=1 Tax=Hyalangium sp. TaxID=2028555 RepID=UPI002D4FC481|nr:alanine racemase [Hyalangium sp.]HYI00376.1 alanine racemase [Hyalangium sp.]